MNPAQPAIDNASIFSSQADDQKSQYLTFILAGEEYGVDILRVQEIKGWNNVTPIPNTPVYIKGVMNLRGTIVPIIDLRQRFGLENLEYGPMTVVIVLKVLGENKNRIMGIVVDAVSDVYDIDAQYMRPPPDFGEVINIEYLKGLASVNDKMVIILDIDHLLSGHELERIVKSDRISTNKNFRKTNVGLSAADVELIEDSFAKLSPSADLIAESFYEDLFRNYPEVRGMFANTSMGDQQRKLVSALTLVVKNLRNPEALESTLHQLGHKHLSYGAKAAHYDAVNSTMLEVLSKFAKENWTDATQKAWQNALTLVAGTMLEAQ